MAHGIKEAAQYGIQTGDWQPHTREGNRLAEQLVVYIQERVRKIIEQKRVERERLGKIT